MRLLTVEKNRLEDEVQVFKFYELENKQLRATLSNYKSLNDKVDQLHKESTEQSEKAIRQMEKWKKRLERVSSTTK